MKLIKLAAVLSVLFVFNVSVAASEKEPPALDRPYVGTVLQSVTEGKYTYMELDVEGKNIWIATMPQFLLVKVGKGDQVEYVGGLLMENFTSKSLDRTFDSILFVTRIKVLMKNSIMLPKDDYHTKKTATQEKFIPVRDGEILKPEGGKSVAEIFAEREQLKDTEIVLQAKVVKVNKNILKRNWITLSDGTGTPPDDKIVFTTTGISNINDIVTVRGIVRTDINLGGNYQYKTLLEDPHDFSQEKGERP